MEKLIEKVENLKTEIGKEGIVLELTDLKNKILNDQELTCLIKKYHETLDEHLKTRIIEHEIFRQYKEKETDLNLLILKINNELKKITKKENGCL